MAYGTDVDKDRGFLKVGQAADIIATADNRSTSPRLSSRSCL
jgi:hypothetical protein